MEIFDFSSIIRLFAYVYGAPREVMREILIINSIKVK